MSVPPTRSGSTPPSGNGDDDSKGPRDTKRKKEFKLPQKQEKGEEKKKDQGLFGILSETQVKEMRQEVSQNAENIKAGETEGIAAKTQVTQISQIIQKMAASMQIGTIGGKDYASVNLAKGPDVPEAFAGTNLTLSYQENGLIIRFDNFTTPQAEQNALLLVESNKDQLTQMIQTLQTRNIQIAELNIGSRQVALPRVQPLPPPFQVQQEGTQEKRDGGAQGEQKEGGEEGPSER